MKETKNKILSDFQFNDQIEKSKFVEGSTLEILLKDKTRIIRYHHTDIITCKPETVMQPNPSIILTSGGWHTMTTKERLNEFAPCNIRIWQDDNIWYVGRPEYEYGNKEKCYIFYDGITLDKKGKLLSRKRKINTKRRNRLKKMIREYVKMIDTVEKLPQPSSGDCWSCFLKSNDGKTMGDFFEDNDHILLHVKQKYLFGSILVNAMKEAGYKDEQIGYNYYLNNKFAFKHALRRYLTRRLLI